MPNGFAIEAGGEVLSALGKVAMEPTSVDPSAEGGVCISFRSGSRFAVLECFNSGEILGLRANNAESEPDIFEVDCTPSAIKSAVLEIQSFVRR